MPDLHVSNEAQVANGDLFALLMASAAMLVGLGGEPVAHAALEGESDVAAR